MLTPSGLRITHYVKQIPNIFRQTALVSRLYSTVTLFARLRGWSTSAPRQTAIS